MDLSTKTLSNIELERIGRTCLPASAGWRGVRLHGELPALAHRPSSFIVNLDRPGGPGTHWVAVHLPASGPAEWWCSYGISPPAGPAEKLTAWAQGAPPLWNPLQLQARGSNDCGCYALLYLLWRAHGGTPEDFTAWFARFPERSARDAAVRSLFAEFLAHGPQWRSAVSGGRLDIHAAIGKLPRPKGGWTLPGHRYTGPYNPLERQLDEHDRPLPGQEPFNAVDATAMRHDI